MNDLRRPTGFLFALLGAILLLYGVISPERAQLEPSVNVNLWCGLMLLIFGVCLLWLSYRAKS
jgi:drug/metabolite transporter (DMT)-like permease